MKKLTLFLLVSLMATAFSLSASQQGPRLPVGIPNPALPVFLDDAAVRLTSNRISDIFGAVRKSRLVNPHWGGFYEHYISQPMLLPKLSAHMSKRILAPVPTTVKFSVYRGANIMLMSLDQGDKSVTGAASPLRTIGRTGGPGAGSVLRYQLIDVNAPFVDMRAMPIGFDTKRHFLGSFQKSLKGFTWTNVPRWVWGVGKRAARR